MQRQYSMSSIDSDYQVNFLLRILFSPKFHFGLLLITLLLLTSLLILSFYSNSIKNEKLKLNMLTAYFILMFTVAVAKIFSFFVVLGSSLEDYGLCSFLHPLEDESDDVEAVFLILGGVFLLFWILKALTAYIFPNFIAFFGILPTTVEVILAASIGLLSMTTDAGACVLSTLGFLVACFIIAYRLITLYSFQHKMNQIDQLMLQDQIDKLNKKVEFNTQFILSAKNNVNVPTSEQSHLLLEKENAKAMGDIKRLMEYYEKGGFDNRDFYYIYSGGRSNATPEFIILDSIFD